MSTPDESPDAGTDPAPSSRLHRPAGDHEGAPGFTRSTVLLIVALLVVAAGSAAVMLTR